MPQCRGIWLDRGEIDKILERANSEGDRWYRDDKWYKHDPRRRKKNWLMDIFDWSPGEQSKPFEGLGELG